MKKTALLLWLLSIFAFSAQTVLSMTPEEGKEDRYSRQFRRTVTNTIQAAVIFGLTYKVSSVFTKGATSLFETLLVDDITKRIPSGAQTFFKNWYYCLATLMPTAFAYTTTLRVIRDS